MLVTQIHGHIIILRLSTPKQLNGHRLMRNQKAFLLIIAIEDTLVLKLIPVMIKPPLRINIHGKLSPRKHKVEHALSVPNLMKQNIKAIIQSLKVSKIAHTSTVAGKCKLAHLENKTTNKKVPF